jgi:hypothetical protein
VMAADWLYGEFYGFYSVSSEYFRHHRTDWSKCYINNTYWQKQQ